VYTVEKLVRKYGIIAVVVFGTGGGAAILTVPSRVARLERDHASIIRHQARQEAGQDYILCVVGERAKDGGGDARTCESLKPRRRATLDEEMEPP